MANKRIILGEKIIDENSQPYLIAEVGINHNGDINIAKKIVEIANESGWDIVKFQKREPDIAVPESQKNIMRDTPWGLMTYYEYKKKIEFGEKEYSQIDKLCRQKKFMWTASPWDCPSLEFILKFNVPFIKIASASLTDSELVREAAISKKPIIMSTGMSTIEEIDEAVNILEKSGNGDYILLHTNSTYPSKYENLNLNMISTLKNRYDCLVGYSGHEIDADATLASVALGAKVIERHITISKDLWGTDQKASLPAEEMILLKKRIDQLSKGLGDGIKRIYNDELFVRKKLRGY